jgi:hypothetical protein
MPPELRLKAEEEKGDMENMKTNNGCVQTPMENVKQNWGYGMNTVEQKNQIACINRMGTELIDIVTKAGTERAESEGIPFKLTRQHLTEIIANHVNENSDYLKPETIEHYQQLLFGAVACCNWEIATGAAKSLSEILMSLNEHRRKGNPSLRSA